ncbi:hypothetical protein BH20PSE1_BH20PSE1_08360 [soil metagenome]
MMYFVGCKEVTAKDSIPAAPAVEWFRANIEYWAEHASLNKERHRDALKAAEKTLEKIR